MCEFISWVEVKTAKQTKVYFLTHDLVRNTPQGEVIQKQFSGGGELIGHAAIRAYFNLGEGGINKECTDFSTPDNFPTSIIKAIKEGKFRGFGEPKGLLTALAGKAYQEAKAPAWKAYQEAIALAGKAYQEATAPAWKAYQEATAPAWKAYQEAKAPAWKAYQEAIALAEKAYQEATAPAWKAYQEATAHFWDLFAKPENRNPAWVAEGK